jgi:hypothetical protein
MLPFSARVHNCLPACIETEYKDMRGRYTPYIFAESTDGASDSYTGVCDRGDSDFYRDNVVGLLKCCTASVDSLLGTFWDSIHFDS